VIRINKKKYTPQGEQRDVGGGGVIGEGA